MTATAKGTAMYILTDLAKATQDEKQRGAALAQPHGRVDAARRAGNRSGAARRLALPRVLRGRRTAQAH
ncbi:MAG TPA: hypothetical protein VGM53_17005 [Streptosporangiaceae bacterium]|jgi:ABC-type arginine transport system permease subunit